MKKHMVFAMLIATFHFEEEAYLWMVDKNWFVYRMEAKLREILK